MEDGNINIKDNHENIFNTSRIINSRNGWLSPTGIFTSCTSKEHDASANFVLEKKRIFVERVIEKNEPDLKNEILKGSSRTILKEAGYLLISHNLIADQNMPDKLTDKQMHILKQANLPTSPEAYKLPHHVYTAFNTKVLGSYKKTDSGKSVNNTHFSPMEKTDFLDDSQKDFFLVDKQGLVDEIFATITQRSSSTIELCVKNGGQDDYKLKRINLLDEEIWVKLHRHYHDLSTGTMGYINDVLTLLSTEQMINFTHRELQSGKRDSKKITLKGDIELLKN